MIWPSRVRFMRHIGQDVPKRHTHFVLECKLMYEKSFRDSWLDSLCRAVSQLDEPMAKNVSRPQQRMLQRKVACYQYNQFGLFNVPYYRLANVDRYYAIQGVAGTREWVPYVNVSYWTMNKMVRSGNLLVHRVHYTGWGTDTHLKRGGWEHRWNKVMQRNVLQYNRI
ncbi:hypothetical protein ERJ75_000749300 [Trypanosoma vivax]|uniref:Uncharacterized protein n=1 Tax=Trypanosoma vivax (strain Y486) TaxID=1055687 RepID=G0U079_TRYVY|nr:hypothetical protein TRVL_00571 [Trypanosoma vivax]KAH8613659.1 hypothetical protein ERJ75_000749300 [Trypanosoma vivax]CCC49477.1 conserved hypothetical protein [Trypanosoma vivax Y486]